MASVLTDIWERCCIHWVGWVASSFYCWLSISFTEMIGREAFRLRVSLTIRKFSCLCQRAEVSLGLSLFSTVLSFALSLKFFDHNKLRRMFLKGQSEVPPHFPIAPSCHCFSPLPITNTFISITNAKFYMAHVQGIWASSRAEPFSFQGHLISFLAPRTALPRHWCCHFLCNV